MGALKNLLDLIFPPRCVFCGKFLHSHETGICSTCKITLPFAEGPAVRRSGDFFDFCIAPLYYKDDVRRSVLRFKFRGATGNASVYAGILSDCIREEISGKYDIISWVPISKKREKTRGYDQSMLLALATALELGDVAVETLRKTTDTPAQSSLSGAEKRRANVAGVYEVKDPELIAGKRILLIDDVMTTGSTLSECARTLLMAGAESVLCAALAQTAHAR